MSKLLFMKERFKNLDYEDHDDYAYLINRKNQRRIYVEYALPGDHIEDQSGMGINDEDHYTFRFEAQHRHFYSKEMLLDCIEAYASEKVAAIEFSEAGTNRFGGDICTSVLADVTHQSLASRFGHVPSQFNGMTFEIKSWNGTYDAKGIIEKTEHGYKIVQ